MQLWALVLKLAAPCANAHDSTMPVAGSAWWYIRSVRFCVVWCHLDLAGWTPCQLVVREGLNIEHGINIDNQWQAISPQYIFHQWSCPMDQMKRLKCLIALSTEIILYRSHAVAIMQQSKRWFHSLRFSSSRLHNSLISGKRISNKEFDVWRCGAAVRTAELLHCLWCKPNFGVSCEVHRPLLFAAQVLIAINY